jgi:hypothetical protein
MAGKATKPVINPNNCMKAASEKASEHKLKKPEEKGK